MGEGRHLVTRHTCRGGIASNEHLFSDAARNSPELYHRQGIWFNPCDLAFHEKECATSAGSSAPGGIGGIGGGGRIHLTAPAATFRQPPK